MSTKHTDVPDGFVLMPRRLTAENGAKAAMISEFYEEISIICNECGNDDSIECDACEGVGVVTQRVTVGWDTIKDIYAKAVEVCAAAPAQEQQQ